MNQFHHPSEMHRLTAQQLYSLEKHEAMINDTLRWQRQARLSKTSSPARPQIGLRHAFTTVLHLLGR